jgi:exopolysaccharide biosynthesis polyprenyl glycosylphosphotransferase
VVVGTGPVAAEIFQTLQHHPECGVQPLGFIGPEPAQATVLPGALLAPLSELSDILAGGYIRRIVVDPDGMAAPDLDLILHAAAASRVEVHIAARNAEASTAAKGSLDHVRCHPLLWVPRRWSRPEQLLWKRFSDLAVSVLALVVLAPSLLLIAGAVRLSSRGPILFRQERLGQHGRPISVLKFRSMRVNDDSDVTWSVRADDRITPIGRFLRATSLDELPQLLCIAKGEMSLVGARPERPFFVRRFERLHARYPARHRLRVGLTGLSQVHDLRGDTSIAERTRFDNFYIDHWSVWSDAVVLVRTLSAVVRYGRSPE